jgi:Potential Queuosine, Q, salvage protein family
MSVSEQVRSASAWVAERARFVRIEQGALEAYAGTLPPLEQVPGLDPETHVVEGDRELRAAFIISLDAINFGSGWWPTIRKRPGLSGYFTVAAALADRFRADGAFSADELRGISPATVASLLGQEPEHPLMAQFASSLRDVGAHVGGEYGGRFADVVDAAGKSACALADRFARWDAFADRSRYEGREVPFFKRAQLAAADLGLAEVVSLSDRDRLTAFADNLVPQVLRVDGVLRLEQSLEAAIEAGELLEHGSPREVELRACTVHAVELLANATGWLLAPVDIDYTLWNRGQAPRYKALPRPRSRTTAY